MTPAELDACPSCRGALDTTMKRTNVRTEQGQTVLSCPWCWKVFTIEADGQTWKRGLPDAP